MDSQPYTNREIDQQHKELMDILSRIEVQTTKTNGSVATAFKEINRLKGWRTGLTMSAGLVLVIIIPLILYIYNFQFSIIKSELDQHIIQTDKNK